MQAWIIGTSWLLKDSRQAVGSMESRTLYSVRLWTQVFIVLSGWGWAQPVDQKVIAYCAKHNFSPLARSSNWGIIIQEPCSRHALGERERLRREGASSAEVYSNLKRKIQEEVSWFLQGWGTSGCFPQSLVLGLWVFILLPCDSSPACLSP